MRIKAAEQRYNDNVRKQRKTLEDFAENETEWAGYLIEWYGVKKEEIPDDEYRACAFFLNKEFLFKPGSLTMLYETCIRCHKELPQISRENAFEYLRFQFRMYAKVLRAGRV